jgi:hypothetical protein
MAEVENNACKPSTTMMLHLPAPINQQQATDPATAQLHQQVLLSPTTTASLQQIKHALYAEQDRMPALPECAEQAASGADRP